jgi:hypothetical protein
MRNVHPSLVGSGRPSTAAIGRCVLVENVFDRSGDKRRECENRPADQGRLPRVLIDDDSRLATLTSAAGPVWQRRGHASRHCTSTGRRASAPHCAPDRAAASVRAPAHRWQGFPDRAGPAPAGFLSSLASLRNVRVAALARRQIMRKAGRCRPQLTRGYAALFPQSADAFMTYAREERWFTHDGASNASHAEFTAPAMTPSVVTPRLHFHETRTASRDKRQLMKNPLH